MNKNFITSIHMMYGRSMHKLVIKFYNFFCYNFALIDSKTDKIYDYSR